MSGPLTAQIPMSVIEQLAGAAAQMNIDLPGIAKFAPTVDMSMSIRPLALELGRIVAKQDIFLKGESIVTVDASTGDVKPMTASRFVGWVEEFVAFKNSGRSQRLRDSLAREDAALILDQDIFRSCLRPLSAVHLMRLPVRRSGELWPHEFLKPGYDAESAIFTAEVLPYAMDWTLDQATEFINAHGEGYPWSWPDEKDRILSDNRNFAVHLAAMLGVYCRAMFPPGVRRPMIAYVANQAGTGKSTLVAMALLPTFGHADNTKIPKDDDNMNAELNTVAINRRPYLFFDDIGGGIFSHPLNAFVTATGRAGRILGGDMEFREKLATQVFCTGNDIKISNDLMRRSLVSELFLAGDLAGREFAKEITVEYLALPETRAKFLAAFCAIVRYANEYLQTALATGAARPAVRGVATFEDFTSTISTMVQIAGYRDPLTPPDLSTGGDEDNDEMRELLVKVATASDGDREFDRKELVTFARTHGLLEPLVGLPDDKELDSSAMKRWGRQLQKWRGRELADLKGRRFRFSHKRQKRGAKYPLTFIKPKQQVPAANE